MRIVAAQMGKKKIYRNVPTKSVKQKIITAIKHEWEYGPETSKRFDIMEGQYGSNKTGFGRWIVTNKKTQTRYEVLHYHDEYTGKPTWNMEIRNLW